ncbi:2-amino-4-hydroxy-6-hydroxymethyldihydropteridine diphosphokinase [Gammaproteobacteria bacterium]|jgi:2-amino-4-hydroxy-6-hydroxymethyldihydropteridine diphosphokinase|nr:2-amino-4-hydroxy-6-hydroxymethyldihydropteridine diphosphokinase [Gammaproteobacteria bacterium]MDO7702519.1 2-amino-4-hydroxy-6-hydroxymethyldihydropteridine diphosphokinase [SAR86 cluster bacterium]MDA7695867.1 2-amino-4-hydroxy-6-hydroxymethyldihydropteridine diphosphokinase [Gammaproteobacteria bacterium]MDA7702628.1 2-amino-4-hydroxy-6-hydroxymethyldihydropteridine diphosphokinase [Gammaproteobacteria bacterium]MDA7710349.1 2-amino-4-hydroxy-6-hydroxymethyldihydropteridine diphosphokin|tara:strand:- start:2180 stop:2554 length:375 start_codon:yes stop_codon:yes gene_type:complete
MKFYLSLGSNINAEANIILAIEKLQKILDNSEYSSVHQTKAEGFEGDDFLNLVVSGDAELSFDELNKKLKDIEDEAGRNRDAPKFSARTLDIDIVLQIDDEEIIFESDEVTKYSFVSEPLKELL